ncbi:MAG: transcription termination factor Rho [Lachnospiraceae bacterium]|nr:transcription termination factor Rho [Lachnospiraceae bacterium]
MKVQREQLETLPVAQLKEIAKANDIKGVTTLKKADLIEAILQMSEEKTREEETGISREEEKKLDSGIVAHGILEVLPDGYGFIRCDNYLPGDADVYVSPSQIKRFSLKTGDILKGKVRVKTQNEKFGALLHLDRINGVLPSEATNRRNFEDLTPIFPDERLSLETSEKNVAMRIFDLVSPIGKGQRGMIVSPPKAGKTTLLKGVAHSIQKNNPEVHILILLIDERPEEVTDIKEAIVGDNVEVIYSTFDELPEHHKRVSEMVIERAKRLVEHGEDVIILLDSITRLARAYNLLVPPSGRTLSGGLDPAALHMPKRFFGAARNIREGGSLTILATALVDTGSKMDDVVYEEFKGTGNMELILDRKLQEKRIFPAIDIAKSGTRREDLLLTQEEQEAVYIIRKATGGLRADEATEKILDLFARTRSNKEFVDMIRKIKLV